jgi:hypothetical protein
MSTKSPIRRQNDEDNGRRLACDRCRGQKLRCDRSSNSSPCRRCTRARARCTTTCYQRMGRPSKSLEKEGNKNTQDASHEPYSDGWNLNNATEDGNMFSSTSDVPDEFNFSVNNPMIDPFTSLDQILDIDTSAARGSINPDSNTGFVPAPDSGISMSDSPLSGIDHFEMTEYLNSDTSWMKTLETSNSKIVSTTLDHSSHGQISPKEGAVQKFSVLSSSVLENLSQMGACRKDIGTNKPSYRIPSQTIGHMFQSSERLLEILEDLTTNLRDATSPPSHSAKNDGRGSKSLDSVSALGSNSFPPKLDISTRIAALTCLACLIRVYEYVFNQIHESLLLSSPLPEESLPTLPCLQFDNFNISKHRNLHLHLVAQVSSYLVSQIEKALEVAGLGNLDDPASTGLFDIILGSRTGRGAEGNGIGKSRLKILGETIAEVAKIAITTDLT